LLQSVRDFWSTRFFSNEYLHYDVPYLGAISFVQDLADTGCEIFYLTGRDRVRMLDGTIEVLKKWGFPYKRENLFLKPEKGLDDELFKLEWFNSLNHSLYKNVFFFENEPVNINAIVKACPEVDVIFLDTTHSRKEQITAPLKQIKNFVRS
ncbi:MAG: HAD family hydrolase, partial [Pseudobdellovibrio sp.]